MVEEQVKERERMSGGVFSRDEPSMDGLGQSSAQGAKKEPPRKREKTRSKGVTKTVGTRTKSISYDVQ